MHYLGLALYAEGPTDERFLSPVLLRLCADVCAQESRYQVEINDEMLVLGHSPKLKDAPRAERVAEAARQARGAWSILFVHADADGDHAKARRERAQPALDRLRLEFDQGGQGVAVIPVQATEAWAICDGDAIRRVFGTTLTDRALALPSNVAAIERMADPKQCFHASFSASRVTAGRRRPSRSADETLGALGECVAMERLRQLTGFRVVENELRQALRAVHVLD